MFGRLDLPPFKILCLYLWLSAVWKSTSTDLSLMVFATQTR